jgi:DNA-binding transcriptional LysR family regulator
VAVARHLHFGRAAEELHIAQPVLSRQIRALEHELHVQLFRRDRRTTELTESGRELLEEAGPLLANADALLRRVARGTNRFVVAFMPGLIVTTVVGKFRAAHPEVAVEVLRTSWHDQVEVLRDGRADAGYLRLPVDTTGLTVRPVLTEPRVAVVASAHPLAGREEVRIAELAGDTLLQDPAAVPEWRAVATTEAAPAPAVAVEEKLENVASGRGFAVLPLSTAKFYTRPDVSWMPVGDIEDNKVVLAWVAGRRSPLLRSFAALAEGIPPR